MADGGDAPRPQLLRLAGMAIALAVLSVALRVPSFVDAPLDRDEGAYALVAQQWRRGTPLYREYFDHKPPLVYAAYRASFLIAGEHLAAVRLLFALMNACTALACALSVQRLTNQRALPPLLTAVATCVFLNSPLVQGQTANTEALMVLATAVSACVLLRASQTARGHDTLLAGVCSGLAILAKPVALCEAAFFAAWLTAQTGRWRRELAAFGVGLLLPGAAWATCALMQGTLAASIDAVVFYSVRYASAAVVPLWARVVALPIEFGVPLALLWAGVAGCTLTALRSEPRPANFALGWTLAALTGTLASGRLYDHYYQQLIPPMAVALGVTAAAIGRLTRTRVARLGYGVVVAVGLWPPLAANWSFAARAADRACDDWQSRLATVVRGLTAPDDRILIWGAEPYLAFAAERRPLSRFIYKYPLLGDGAAAVAARRELFAAWDTRRPAVIVVVKRETTAEPGRSAVTEIIGTDAPFHRLLRGFAPAVETPDFALYVQTTAPPQPWSLRWEQALPTGCTR